MEYKFKTTINCGGCITKVTPLLNAETDIKTWEVDTTNQNKILTVQAESGAEDKIIDVVKKAGFKIKPLN